MWRAREQERKTFANMVHDGLLQSIVGGVYALEALRETVIEEGLADFDHVVHSLRLSVEDARRIIWELRPPVLDSLGLSESIGAIADRIAVESDTRVSVSVKGIEGLDEGTATAVYKIAREALLNAERHAQAMQIELQVVPTDVLGGPAVSLTVKDDGCGFNSGCERLAGHYGLFMMEEQAAAVGGVLRVASVVGTGTVVHLIAPLRVPSAPGGEP
jgi:signal transduction histidine kinase